jgi:hypothetical protein
MNKTSFSLLLPLFLYFSVSCSQTSEIDRYSLVTRHNIENTSTDSLNSLSVGNGEFAFTVDITGLQTFPENYATGIPLGTMSNWGWHTAENSQNYQLKDVYKEHDVHGRQVEYVSQFRGIAGDRKFDASEWLRSNPHRAHLGTIGLHILNEDGTEIKISDLVNPVQKLDLWKGEIESRFTVGNHTVKVITVCHPGYDLISVKIVSDLIGKSRLKVKLSFPSGSPTWNGFNSNLPEDSHTSVMQDTDNITLFKRKQDNDTYNILLFKNSSKITEVSEHLYYLVPQSTDSVFTFSCHFLPDPGTGRMQSFEETRIACNNEWDEFWRSGGAVDFSDCTDPRAEELERRVILSQYLTKIQCSGSLPPAETGLTFNSWYGKFHLEMHWWHGVHFALWNRADILDKQMGYYFDIIENARSTAVHQGYKGVRWPKMVGPDGRESPSNVGTYLIWQQPHPIFYSELLYESATDKTKILNKYSKLVFETADFMASYAWLDSAGDRYVLGPVLIPAQESLKLETTINPAFELVYWYWGLKTAQEWRKRMGLEPLALWNDIINKISELPVQNGLYLCSEDTKDSYENQRYMSDHPIVSGISGVLPETKMVDSRILGNSLDTIMKKWNWKTTWGWDFPMLAMSAASIGREEQAMDFLLMDAPKNRYLLNGHNYQDARLSIYLPGNGGLLTAVASMCVSDQFPHNKKWNVKWENLNQYVK